MITEAQVRLAQEQWGKAIIAVGRLKYDPTAYRIEAERLVDGLYNYQKGRVLFKPTVAADIPFRLTREGAISYMIGGNADYPEDHGFALQPWMAVRFENAGTVLDSHRALAMGYYVFTDPLGEQVTAQYTFGYVEDAYGQLRIDVHHSSLPYVATG